MQLRSGGPCRLIRSDDGAPARRFLSFVLACLLISPAVALAAEELRGDAIVISGNKIIVGKQTVKLFGMAAPGLEDLCEINRAKIKCGIVAWAELVKLADGQFVSCDIETAKAEKSEEIDPKDKQAQAGQDANRDDKEKAGKVDTPVTPKGDGKRKADEKVTFATCYLGETDLNEALVRSGWARAVLQQTDRYSVDETDAKESLRGLWANEKKPRRRKKKKKKK